MKMDAPAISEQPGYVALSPATMAFAEDASSPTAGAYVIADRMTTGRPLRPKDETSFFQIALVAAVVWVAFKFAR